MAVYQNSIHFFLIKLFTVLSVLTRHKNDKENTDDGEKWSDLDKVEYL